MYLHTNFVNYSEKSTFKGLNTLKKSAEIADNRYLLTIAQDRLNERISVAMPGNKREAEILDKYLDMRSQLDEYFRLANKKGILNYKLGEIYRPVETVAREIARPLIAEKRTKLESVGLKPKSFSVNFKVDLNPEVQRMCDDLKKEHSGRNLRQVYEELESKMAEEANSHPEAIAYFEELNKLESEYERTKKISVGQLEKAWTSIQKNNLNPNGEYSTAELRDIVKERLADPVSSSKKPVTYTKKQLLNLLETKYEDLMRTELDFLVNRNDRDVQNIIMNIRRNLLAENNAIIKRTFDINGNAETDSLLPRINSIFEKKDKVIIHKMNTVSEKMKKLSKNESSLYYLNGFIRLMEEPAADIRSLIKDIEVLENQLNNDSARTKSKTSLKKAIDQKEHELKKCKKDWLNKLNTTRMGIMENRNRVEEAGVLNEYKYLTDKNEILNTFMEALDTCDEYGKEIPNDVLLQIIDKMESTFDKYDKICNNKLLQKNV